MTGRVPDNEVIGAGVIYGNYGETDQFEMGATLGGNPFNMNATYKGNMSDSDILAYTKGAIDVDTLDPTLTINSLQWNIEGYTYFAGMAAAAISTSTVTIHQGATVAYPLTNIAIVTENRGGYAKAYVLNDPVALNGFQFDGERVTEIVKPLEFHATADPATFDADDPTTFPMYIVEEASLLTISVVDNLAAPVVGAVVVLRNGQSGTSAAVTGVVPDFTVSKGTMFYTSTVAGHDDLAGSFVVDTDAEAQTIVMQITA